MTYLQWGTKTKKQTKTNTQQQKKTIQKASLVYSTEFTIYYTHDLHSGSHCQTIIIYLFLKCERSLHSDITAPCALTSTSKNWIYEENKFCCTVMCVLQIKAFFCFISFDMTTLASFGIDLKIFSTLFFWKLLQHYCNIYTHTHKVSKAWLI